MAKRLTNSRNERYAILAVHPGALGDVVLFGHLLSALGGRVTLAAGREKAELLRGLGVVEAVLDFDLLPMHEIFTDAPPAQCRLPGMLGRHDRLVSCFPGEDSRAQQRLAAMCGAAGVSFLPVRPGGDWSGHLLDLWAKLLPSPRPGHFRDPSPRPWSVPDAWRRDARDVLTSLGVETSAKYTLIHPGAGAPDKCWPLERFLALAGRVETPVFILGPVEWERWPQGQLAALRRDWPVLLCPPLTHLAAAAGNANAFVGNDSGASHLAAAVGAPTVALFGPTRAEHFAPRGRSVKTLCAAKLQDIEVWSVIEALRGAGSLDH